MSFGDEQTLSAVKRDLRNLMTAQEAYRQKWGGYAKTTLNSRASACCC